MASASSTIGAHWDGKRSGAALPAADLERMSPRRIVAGWRVLGITRQGTAVRVRQYSRRMVSGVRRKYLLLFSFQERLATGHGADDEQRFLAARHCLRQRSVGVLVRQIPAAGKKADQRAATLRGSVADRAAQDGVARFQRIEQRPLGDRRVDCHGHFFPGAGQCAQVVRQHDADHGNVWTSTESTGGRSWTMAAHVSPESAEA